MDFLERFNSKFGSWYEGLFGGGESELRPKDVLRKITGAMEDHRKEGFDGKVYVPNKYVLELSVADPEERDYLLSFLDEEELVSVLQRFMAQNQYHTRGALDFTIAEVPPHELEAGREKLRVRARFEKSAASASPLETDAPPATSPSPFDRSPLSADDLPTVSGLDYDEEEPGTVPAVAWAALAITTPDGRKNHFSLTRPLITIGRSRNAGNDLILDNDGLVSKVHARLERERDGRFALYDVGSTNGIKVNGSRIESNRILKEGDEILIGGTKLVFQHAGEEAPQTSYGWEGQRERPSVKRGPRLVTSDGKEFLLASETLLGRAITSDVILDGPGVATRHARIIVPDWNSAFLEPLAADYETRLNDRLVPVGRSVPLKDGDTIVLGSTVLRYLGSAL